MLNFEKLTRDIMTATSLEMPPDSGACKECTFYPDNLKYDGGGWCYMFKKLPDTLCMQFKRNKE